MKTKQPAARTDQRGIGGGREREANHAVYLFLRRRGWEIQTAARRGAIRLAERCEFLHALDHDDGLDGSTELLSHLESS